MPGERIFQIVIVKKKMGTKQNLPEHRIKPFPIKAANRSYNFNGMIRSIFLLRLNEFSMHCFVWQFRFRYDVRCIRDILCRVQDELNTQGGGAFGKIVLSSLPVSTSSVNCYYFAASQNLPLGEPLDWMETAIPKKWRLNGNVEIFDWD